MVQFVEAGEGRPRVGVPGVPSRSNPNVAPTSTADVGLAAELFERVLGKRPSPEMLWRWRTRGIRLPDGTVVKLSCRRCGRRWFTTEAAVREFIDRQTRAHSLSNEEAATNSDLVERLKAAGLT